MAIQSPRSLCCESRRLNKSTSFIHNDLREMRGCVLDPLSLAGMAGILPSKYIIEKNAGLAGKLFRVGSNREECASGMFPSAGWRGRELDWLRRELSVMNAEVMLTGDGGEVGQQRLSGIAKPLRVSWQPDTAYANQCRNPCEEQELPRQHCAVGNVQTETIGK